jgi:hypothetical protein
LAVGAAVDIVGAMSPSANFTLLDVSRPEIATLLAAML